jgi:hypothetical protein
MKPIVVAYILAFLCAAALAGYLILVLSYPVPAILVMSLVLATASLACLLTFIYIESKS